MSSLSVHLRQTEDHSALPFHPSCPVCRSTRLSGSLDGDELVSRRTQAALAVGLLAFSAAAPPVAVAAGPDEEIEGSVEVVETGDAGSLDLGEPTVAFPDEAPAAPEEGPATPADGSGEASIEPASDEAAVEAETEASEPAAAPAPAPEPVAVAAPPAEAPPATGAPEQPAAVGARVDDRATTKREHRASRSKHSPATVQLRQVAAPAPAPAPPTPATVRIVAGTSTGQAPPGGGFHTVRPGESLWSIASDLLGERASVTSVAREVNRLWALNDDRIATGSPDLLYAGTRLRLR